MAFINLAAVLVLVKIKIRQTIKIEKPRNIHWLKLEYYIYRI